MFTLYFLGGILVLAAAIYGLIKLSDRLESTYDYSMFDWVNNIGILCGTSVITLLIIAICIYGHEGEQYQGGAFDGSKNIEMLFFVNVAVLVFVFIRNWSKSSLICSLIITPIQVIAATALLLTLFIVLQMVENLGKKLFGGVGNQRKVGQ